MSEVFSSVVCVSYFSLSSASLTSSSLRSANSFDPTDEDDRAVLQCVPFSVWSGSESTFSYMDHILNGLMAIESGTYCLASDMEKFLEHIGRPDVDDANFVTQCIQQVINRKQVQNYCIFVFFDNSYPDFSMQTSARYGRTPSTRADCTSLMPFV